MGALAGVHKIEAAWRSSLVHRINRCVDAKLQLLTATLHQMLKMKMVMMMIKADDLRKENRTQNGRKLKSWCKEIINKVNLDMLIKAN